MLHRLLPLACSMIFTGLFMETNESIMLYAINQRSDIS